MAKTRLEWQLGRETWSDRPPEPPERPPRRIRLSLRTATVLLAILLLAGAVVGIRYRANSAALRAALIDAVSQETLVWNAGAGPAYAELLDPSAPETWRAAVLDDLATAHSGPSPASRQVSVENVDWRGDVAAVDVRFVQTPGRRLDRWHYYPAGLAGGLPQVTLVENLADEPVQGTETRFYRLAGNQWRRTAPDPRFLGPEEKLVTTHFELHYRREDAEAGRRFAEALEDTAAGLAARYAQPPLADRERLLVRLLPGLPGPAWEDTGVYLPAPSTAPRIEGEDPDAHLLLLLRATLVGKMIDRLVGEKPPERARVLALAVTERELEDATPGDWRQTYIRVLVERWPKGFRPLLSMLKDDPSSRPDDSAVEAWLLVRYIARRYGEARLAELIRLAGETDDWDDLIERGLGISPAELYAGWWSALAGEYVMAPYRRDPAGLDLARLQTDLRAAVQADFDALRDPSGPRILQTLDPRAPARWRAEQIQAGPLPVPAGAGLEVEPVQVHDDIALVLVRARPPAGQDPVALYRFYRYDGERWWHTPPVEAFWGEGPTRHKP